MEPTPPSEPKPASPSLPKRTRRSFLKRAIWGTAGLLTAGLVYTGIEACWINVVRKKIAVPRLPLPWQGTTVALLTDLHHGPYTGLGYIRRIVELTNALEPDLIFLTGDYVHRDPKYIAPCQAVLADLRGKLGVYAVPGNHDYYEGIDRWLNALPKSIQNVTNGGVWLDKQGTGLRIAGIDDLWNGKPDLAAALETTGALEACLLLCHNPDFVEIGLTDPRVSLVLSGHTHGGQAVFPLIGAPIVPSYFGQKYLHGLVQGPHALVYVSRGLGTITPPLRFCSPPELTLIELACQGEEI